MAHILAIDDETSILESYRVALEDVHNITLTENGKDGLKALESGFFDLVLLDISMPGMSGLEVLSKIRQEGHDCAVLIITVHKDIEIVVEQALKYRPSAVGIASGHCPEAVKKRIESEGIDILLGPEATEEIAGADGYDLLVNSVVGAAGLLPTLRAIDAGKDVKKLPMSLGEALEELRNDEVIRSSMPGEMYRVFEHYKRDEWERYNATVTDWDVETYLDCLP